MVSEKIIKNIKKLRPDSTDEDIKRMIEIAKEHKINDPEKIIELFISEKIEKEKNIEKEKLKESWSQFQRDLQYIKRLDLPEEEKVRRRKEAYTNHLRRMNLLKLPAIPEKSNLPVPLDYYDLSASKKDKEKSEKESSEEVLDKEKLRESWSEFQRRLQTLKNLDIPEEKKAEIRKALYEQHLERIGKKEKPEEKKPRGLWLGKVLWPIHKLEPEETRLLRAIPWAKRRLDGIARTKNREVIIRYRKERMEKFVKDNNLEEMKKKVKDLEKELKKLEKERNEIRERILRGERGLEAVLESKDNDLKRKQEEYEKEKGEYSKKLKELERIMKDVDEDVAVLREILRAESQKVLEETCKRFNIVYLRDDIRISLENFAAAEAEHMARNNYRTLYQSFSGWFVKEIYRPVKGVSSSAYGIIEYSWNFLFEFIFSPVVTGTLLVWILFSIFIRYVMTGPTLAVLIITIIITVIMSIGKIWSEEYEKIGN